MAEDKKLQVHGVPTPKGTSWLKEVKIDAARNAVLHLKRQAEERQFEEAKANGVTPAQLIEEGVRDLQKLDPNFRGDFAEDEQDFSFEEEQSSENADDEKPLNKMNKAELKAVAKKENVELSENDTNADLVKAIEKARKGNE